MNRNLSILIALTVSFTAATGFAKEEKGMKIGHTKYVAYEGNQKGPVGEAAQVIRNYSAPVYLGIPQTPYRILGRIVDDRHGFDEISRAFSKAFAEEDARMSYCANQAILRGGDAVMVTGNEQVIKMLALTAEDLKENAPLFEQKDKVTLVIKFLGGPPADQKTLPPAPKPAF